MDGGSKAPQSSVDGATLQYIRNSSNENLCCYFWPQSVFSSPKGIIQVIHGHGSYISHDYLKIEAPGKQPQYSGSWVEAMNRAGFSVCGVDLQGAGRSTGRRFYMKSFDDYVNDGLLMTEEMKISGFDKSVPLFLLGGSLGGCIALMMALRQNPYLISGVALLAPMLSLDKLSKKPINRILKPLVGLLNIVAPRFAAAQVAPNTKFPQLQKIFDLDPLCYHKATRVRSAYEYLRITNYLMNRGGLAEVAFPFIVFHSENDEMCDCDGSKALHSKAKSNDKTLRLINSMWHFITKEPGEKEVVAEAIKWFEGRV